MRKGTVSAVLVATSLCLAPTSAYSADSIVVGGETGWSALVRRSGVSEIAGLRSYPVLALSSAATPRQTGGDGQPEQDAFLTFDEGSPASFTDGAGRYRLSPSPSVSFSPQARAGAGSILFSGPGGLTLTPIPRSGALFSPGSRPGDFSLDFWLYPANLANGEALLSWTASRSTAAGKRVFQRIDCEVAQNRVEWRFADFFITPDDSASQGLTLAARSRLVPRTWTHHELRYDSSTGLVEYLVDGKLEDAAYATSTGREGGELRPPVVGSGGAFVLGPQFIGMIDEFRIFGGSAPSPSLAKYPRAGGRGETRFFDLGTTNAQILRLDAKMSSPPEGETRFFLRAGDSPYGWKDDPASWTAVVPGTDLDGKIRGRWLQVAVVLYPDGDGEQSPTVERIVVSYQKDEAPPPPAMVTAVPRNGAVELKWRPSPDPDLGGYLIYYGESRGEYFGTDASAGTSPLDVGLRTTYLVDGLRDGALYYFTIAAYDRANPRHVGEFSREVSARPTRTAP